MARRKMITRDMILTSAYDLVVKDGFNNFTARNIAKRMGCSTQPLYLEFSCMDDLKRAVIEKIQDYLREDVFSRHYTGDPLIDLSLSYIDLAKNDRSLYRAIYIEDHFGREAMRRFAYEMGMERLRLYPDAQQLSERRQRDIITGNWIISTGLSALVSAGYLDISQDQMVQILTAQLNDFIANDRFQSTEKTPTHQELTVSTDRRLHPKIQF
ncbi:TetR/AcrR family transcriptional regulator [Schleiferilactobacillus shenzhenensis]|nr:TetR family transcriptional regulator [Schleiferilactobacillus shenzhenensis]